MIWIDWFKRCWFKSNSVNRIRWTIKKLDSNGQTTDAGNDQTMFVLTILEKLKRWGWNVLKEV